MKSEFVYSNRRIFITYYIFNEFNTSKNENSKVFPFIIVNISFYANISNEAATNVIMPLEA